MAQKSNIRSMRFSDEIIQMIESQTGDSFTAKFEALVTRCMWELPQKERELERIQNQITSERERLQRIQKKIEALEKLSFDTYQIVNLASIQLAKKKQEIDKL